MADNKFHVAVVGAGVIGLPLATHLVETFPDQLTVTLIADKFSPNTTSDLSGAILEPMQPEGEDAARTKRWCVATFDHARSLCNSALGGETGVSFLRGCFVRGDPKLFPTDDPWYRRIYLGFRELSQSEKEMAGLNSFGGNSIFEFSTYFICCRQYLPWLMGCFTKRGGIVVQKRIENLSELSSYDIVVNCTGLGARDLVDDPDVFPGKGLGIQVKAPWIKNFFAVGEWRPKKTYIFPQSSRNEVVIGGSYLENDYTNDKDPEDLKCIFDRCRAIIPSLTEAEVTESWVAHRPMRKGGVRLEMEKSSSGPAIIHCYGHGGCGVTLHWGCVLDITKLITDTLPLTLSKL